jgi:hypothetical protein
MLVLGRDEDMLLKGRTRHPYDELDCPNDYIMFTESEAAKAHYQMGATAISNEVIFNWLDKTFASSRDEGKAGARLIES